MSSTFGVAQAGQSLQAAWSRVGAQTQEITQGNWGAAFVMFIASFAIVLLGLMAFCVGVFLAIPLVSLIQAVAYCHMTGQRTADRG